MANSLGTILIAENDPVIGDIIGRQTLEASGYRVSIVRDGAGAIAQAVQANPDVIIANLNLPGLSGKDLLVALQSQGVAIPVILIASKGMGNEIIQAFRLGAADYLLWPAREAEVLSAVERILQQVHERQERDQLARQLHTANEELQQRIRELTTIFSMGKAVTSITEPSVLQEKILENAAKIAKAGLAWFLLRDETSKVFVLAAGYKLPSALPIRKGQPWDDGVSSLVAMSGESLAIHGEALRRFRISSLGQAALIVPVKASGQVIGLICLLRHDNQPFLATDQKLVEAIADFASISLINARLFRALEERLQLQQSQVETAQSNDRISGELLEKTRNELFLGLELQRSALESLVKDPTARWNPNQRQGLTQIQTGLDGLTRLSQAIAPIVNAKPVKETGKVNINEIVKSAVNQFQPLALQNNLTLHTNIPQQPIFTAGSYKQITQIIGGLISNAIKFSNPAGVVTITVEQIGDNQVHVSVQDNGQGFDPQQLATLFTTSRRSTKTQPRRFGGLGISLDLIHEIILRLNGKIWVESDPGQGATVHIKIPTIQ